MEANLNLGVIFNSFQGCISVRMQRCDVIISSHQIGVTFKQTCVVFLVQETVPMARTSQRFAVTLLVFEIFVQSLDDVK